MLLRKKTHERTRNACLSLWRTFMKETFLLAVQKLLFTENISMLLKFFIKNLSLFPNKPLIYQSLQPYIQNFSLQFLISDFRRDLNILYFLLGISPASTCSWSTFRNPVSVPSSKAGWTIWRRGNTQKKIYNILFTSYFIDSKFNSRSETWWIREWATSRTISSFPRPRFRILGSCLNNSRLTRNSIYQYTSCQRRGFL